MIPTGQRNEDEYVVKKKTPNFFLEASLRPEISLFHWIFDHKGLRKRVGIKIHKLVLYSLPNQFPRANPNPLSVPPPPQPNAHLKQQQVTSHNPRSSRS
jgi:hypothetical protein